MQDNPHDFVRRKVAAVFRELAGEREHLLRDHSPALPARQSIASACASRFPADVADEIAFHMVDWNYDAAFIVALQLFPERFTPEEVEAGIESFLVHVPAHVLAAARLYGCSTEDIFAESAPD